MQLLVKGLQNTIQLFLGRTAAKLSHYIFYKSE